MASSPYAELGKPTKEWQDFYKEHYDDVPVLVGSPEHLRKIMVELKQRAQSLVPPINEGLSVKDVPMPTSDGASILLRVYTPTSYRPNGYCVLYNHGGGWTLGDLEGEDIACRSTCVKASVVVVSVDYRLAPEHPFPRGLNDSWEAFKWTREHAENLGVDKEKIILAGSSSGGNTTAILAHRARNEGISVVGQILRIPSVCHIDHYPPELNLRSLEDLKDAPLLSKRSMELFFGYLNAPNPEDPEVSPLLAKNFRSLPCTYMQIAGMDPLRDEGLAYADKLRAAGVPVKVDIYPGLPHAFGYFPQLSAASKNSADLINAIHWMVRSHSP